MYNLNIYTIHQVAGKEQSGLPGLWAEPAPRRVARNRNGNQLLIWLKLDGQGVFTSQQQEEILKKLAGAFYDTSGSVTSAMRAAAGSLNEALFNRNLKNSEGAKAVAVLSMAVLNNGLVYVAQCGPTFAYVLGRSRVEVFSDSQSARGLGLSKTTAIRFFQTTFENGDLLLFSHRPPSSWTADSLAGSPPLSLDQIRRRLFNQAGPDLLAALIRIQPGKGEISIQPLGSSASTPVPSQPVRPPAAAPVPVAPPAETPQPVDDSEEATAAPPSIRLAERLEARRRAAPVTQQPVEPVEPDQPVGVYLTGEPLTAEPLASEPEIAPPLAGLPPVEDLEEPIEPVVQPRPARRPEHRLYRPFAGSTPVERAVEKQVEAVVPADRVERIRPARRAQRAPLAPGVTRWLRATLASMFRQNEKVGRLSARAMARVAPGEKDEALKLSPKSMIFIAVAVPVMIAALAVTIYIRNGYGVQHQVYLTEAQEFASQAVAQEDIVLRRQNWMQVLQWIDRAEEYGQTEDSRALHLQAQQAIDSIDGIRRFDLAPAMSSPFAEQVKITDLVAVAGDDIYALDRVQGRIYHLSNTRPGYEVDPDFNCGPGQLGDGGLIIGPLVDLVALPAGNPLNAEVMGIDQNGNLLYCSPGSLPTAAQLTKPDIGWMGLASIAVANNSLLVVDTQTPGVWQYLGDGVAFSDAPHLFFDETIPPLADVIDIAVYQDDLFLLHQDGHMTKCTYSEFDFSPTRCTDPMPYNVQKEGQGESILSLDQPVSQMTAFEDPAPSLYIFGGENPAIYHFSLALNMQNQLRPSLMTEYPLPDEPATAFLITPSQKVVLAFGNEIYYGALP